MQSEKRPGTFDCTSLGKKKTSMGRIRDTELTGIINSKVDQNKKQQKKATLPDKRNFRVKSEWSLDALNFFHHKFLRS